MACSFYKKIFIGILIACISQIQIINLFAQIPIKGLEHNLESLYFPQFTLEGMKNLYQHLDESEYRCQFEATMYDTINLENSINAKVDILYGNIFSNKEKHALVHIISSWDTYIAIYYLKKSQFMQVKDTVLESLSFIGDTIQDVNGDGKKDFLFHIYSTAGCCLRDDYTIYLGLQNNGFGEGHSFLNPNFYPEEHLIRGFGYGHPGDVALYTVYWEGLKPVLLESIYPERKNEPQSEQLYILEDHFNQKKITIRLEEIPVVYQKIKYYDWFLGE